MCCWETWWELENELLSKGGVEKFTYTTPRSQSHHLADLGRVATEQLEHLDYGRAITMIYKHEIVSRVSAQSKSGILSAKGKDGDTYDEVITQPKDCCTSREGDGKESLLL